VRRFIRATGSTLQQIGTLPDHSPACHPGKSRLKYHWFWKGGELLPARAGRGKSEHQRARCRVTVAAVHDRRYGYTRADPDVLPGFDGQCHRKLNRRRRKLAARVKRCGKSAPREAQATRHGKPHRVQGQIGNPGAARSRFRESETDSGYRLHRQMVLSTRKGADRIRLTALPKPIQIPKSGGTSYTGVLPKLISATAERGSVSRSTFNSPKTHGISCARSDSGLLRVADPRSVPFGQHAPTNPTPTNRKSGIRIIRPSD